ncbi:MAG: outer membrane lipoprotein-sorting protein, partial [Vicinamibacterales bacterium]
MAIARALVLLAALVATAEAVALGARPQGHAAGSAGATTPDGVARRIDERDTGRDSRAEMRMRLYDRQGRVRERTMTLLTLHGASRRSDKTLVRFTYPHDIKNTGFLVWEHPDAADERFLYLPALGRVRRIAG